MKKKSDFFFQENQKLFRFSFESENELKESSPATSVLALPFWPELEVPPNGSIRMASLLVLFDVVAVGILFARFSKCQRTALPLLNTQYNFLTGTPICTEKIHHLILNNFRTFFCFNFYCNFSSTLLVSSFFVMQL